MAKTAEKKTGKVVHFAGDKMKEAEKGAVRSFQEMERMFEEFMSRGWMRPSRWDFPTLGDWMPSLERTLSPQVDIIDRDNELLLRAQIPGVNKEDLNLTVADNMVTLEGSSRHEHEEKEEQGNYYRRECSSGSFTRSIPLPCDVESTKATATFENGMLELHLPKINKTTRHTVEIK